MINVDIIGVGGIGGYLTKFIAEYMLKGIIPYSDVNIRILDYDRIESKNLHYQNFKIDELGMYKVVALKNRYLGINSLVIDVKSKFDICDANMVILCVDNDVVRNLVYKTCHSLDIEFIDIRSQGKRVFCLPKGLSYKDDSNFLDFKDKTHYSCQEKEDLKSGQIQFTNRVAASIGFQMFLNYLRGVTNHKINFMI